MVWRVLCAGLALAPSAHADQAKAPGDTPAITITQPPPLRLPIWSEPPPKRFGFFTVTPPETRGEFIRVSVPIGELAMRGTRAVSTARQRRAERKARREVLAAVETLHAQQQ